MTRTVRLTGIIWLAFGLLVASRAQSFATDHDSSISVYCLEHPTSAECHITEQERSGRGGGKRTAPIDWEKLSRQNPREYERLINLGHDCQSLRRGGRKDAQKYRRFCGTQQQQNLDELIREQYKRLPLPAGTITYQPSWGALVNKAEIFYTTTPATHTYALTLLGHDVRLTTHIQTYTWTFGDNGQPVISSKPGQPYPDTTITHIYRQRGTRDVRLTLTYTASYTVDGGPVQTIPGTATVASQPRPLTVHSAHAVLVQGSH
jgi:hypothetical protein